MRNLSVLLRAILVGALVALVYLSVTAGIDKANASVPTDAHGTETVVTDTAPRIDYRDGIWYVYGHAVGSATSEDSPIVPIAIPGTPHC